MRSMLVSLLTLALLDPAVAQSNVGSGAGAEFSGSKSYWVQKREGCQPVVALRIKNTTSGTIGPIEFRLDIVDQDNKSVFASGSASVAARDLPPGAIKEIAIGGDHDIMPRDCLGDMHEVAFSAIHFAVRLVAMVGPNPTRVEIMNGEPMTEERVPGEN
jgi:hypothetical protein